MENYKRWTILFSLCSFLSIAGLSLAENPYKDRLPTVLPFASEQLPDSNLVPVEFEFHHAISPNDSGVGINGSFNGWGDVYKCQNIGSDTWIKVLYLKPGNYQYKFVTYIDTVGQAGVTGWFTDPLNPEYGGPYRDSYITVSDPMIYYFLPLRSSETNIRQPEMTAKISTALKNSVVVSSLKFAIDKKDIPDVWNYFQTQTNKFKYVPLAAMEFGEHTLSLAITNSEGATKLGTTNFTILRGIIEAPFTLQFDGKSPVLELRNPVERVAFEWMDEPKTTELTDADGDGIFQQTLNLKVNKTRIYRVIINQDLYLENDPTNPEISEELRSIVRKIVDTQPRFVDFQPQEGAIFHATDTTITFSARIVTSDSNYAIVPQSIAAWLDGQPVPLTLDTTYDTIQLNFSARLAEGRHVARFTAHDEAGITAYPATLSVGVYPQDRGYHFVDAEDDDNGSGSYVYPAGVDNNSAEIEAIQISLNDTMDSLNFVIEMENISDFTRIGFFIVNSLDGKLIEALDPVELRIPDWQDRGVGAILSAPNSSTLRQNVDNQLFKSPILLQIVSPLLLNSDASVSEHFHFSLAIRDLEMYLGSFNQQWFFLAYSYLVTSSGPFEVTKTEGGLREIQDPDVYDLAFCHGTDVQRRLLQNFITGIQIGGPRLAAIGSEERGAIGLAGSELNSTFIPAPVVKIFARGGKLYQDYVRIAGSVSNASIMNVTIFVNNVEYGTAAIQNNRFEKTITLNKGLNKIYASALYDNNKISSSVPIEYEYIFDPSPIVTISADIANNKITLDGSQSYSPDVLALEFAWSQDPTNPQQVTLSSPNNSRTSFDKPSALGEYYFTLTARAGEHTGWARTVIVVDDSAHTVDLETWHPAWVDSMILYEIFVRTFSVTGKLNAITGRMSMLKDFGINCIWLMPIHPSPSTHGYWITDYYDINPEYGTLADFKKLVDEAHKYGIKVIMDLVINHTVDTHPFMLDAVENGADSPYRDFYYWNPDGSYQYLFSWVNLPSINFSVNRVRDYLIDMCQWWIQKYHVDGFRCDVAHAIEERCPEGPAFWQRWRSELKAMKPDIFLLAEAAASDPRYFAGKFDSGYDYWLYGQVKNALSGTAGATEINQVIRHYLDNIPKHARPMRYLENHDESRLLNQYSVAQTKVAAVIDFSLPGIPLIYAGQEVGELTSRGIVHWGDPNQLKPFYERLIDLRHGHPVFQSGSYVYLSVQNNKIFAYMRKMENDNYLIVSNFSSASETASIRIPLAELPVDTSATVYLNDRLNEISIELKGADLLNFAMTLEPNQAHIYEFSLAPSYVIENQLVQLKFSLSSNYPNPFNAMTQILYTIGGTMPVETKLEIFNILGQKVRELVNERQAPGSYSIIWDGKNDANHSVGTGIYISRLTSSNFVKSCKMLFLR